MEYCYHFWAGTPSLYLDMLDKPQKQVCRTVSPSLSAPFEPLVHPCNVQHIVFSIGIPLADVPLDWMN